MSHQFISPEEVRSWEKIRDLAKECMKASQGERPEVRRLKILYEEERKKKGVSRAAMDALIYERIHGRAPESASSTLKIRYWRTGHHIPANRGTALAFAEALELPPQEAIYEACRLRFRPIMMTTMAAALGAVPLALGQGDGAEIRQPLGITILGGLMVSQVLTLYTTPVVYLCLDRLRLRLRRRWWRLRYGSVRAARLAVLSRRS